VKFAERFDGVHYTCYPHGTASLNAGDLMTVDNTAGDGTWWTFINGTTYQGQSGYDRLVDIMGFGEITPTSSCAGWSASATFTNWQRYNFGSNTWSTIQSSDASNGNCWTVGSLTGGSFVVAH
jgi:hypothetical protein